MYYVSFFFADNKRMAQKKNSKPKSSKINNGALFTTACVVLGLLVILVIFLVKKDQIFTNLKETAFFDRVFGATPEFVEKHEPVPSKEKETIPLKKDEVTIVIEDKKDQQTEIVSMNSLKEDKTEVQVEEKKEPVKAETVKKEEQKKETKKESAPVSTSELQLCFVQFDGDGLVVRKVIKRTVNKNDSPLTNSINLLLKGPDTTKAAEKNCQTLIPAGTKLLSAKVKDGVAYLNFNEAFEINQYGVEGYIGQLMQVVYTATAFSTVNSVQFLIEGQKVDYLGSEGQWIGSPLSRSSF